MADYKLWNALKDAKKYRWVELSHSLNNESPYWSGIPEGSVELAKTVWDWGKPELECLIQTFKFPGQFGTHIDFPGHFIKGKALSEKYDVNDLIFPLVVIDISQQAKKDPRYAVTVEDIKAYEAKYGKAFNTYTGDQKTDDDFHNVVAFTHIWRPQWDAEHLPKLGFTNVRIVPRVNEEIYPDWKQELYAPIDEFLITADKPV